MNALQALIQKEIMLNGPITVARYMMLCLAHPQWGYYMTRDPLGRQGDFTTAPEISQMFGEMVGLWLAQCWLDAGRPAPFRLVELGPGRGTLMRDILLATAQVPGFHDAADIWLVETSPTLRDAQKKCVSTAQWAQSLETVPRGPLFLVANEFFDALPVHQYIRDRDGWRERQIGCAGDELIWGLSAPLPSGQEDPVIAQRPVGDWCEYAPLADAVLEQIRARLQNSGAALIIDYGYTHADRPPGPTLQAVRRHARTDPLLHPGECDLTWRPDFDAMAHALAPNGRWVCSQRDFLIRMNIGARAAALADANPGAADTIADALERLTGPGAMGNLFKVLAAVGPDQPQPAGF